MYCWNCEEEDIVTLCCLETRLGFWKGQYLENSGSHILPLCERCLKNSENFTVFLKREKEVDKEEDV